MFAHPVLTAFVLVAAAFALAAAVPMLEFVGPVSACAASVAAAVAVERRD